MIEKSKLDIIKCPCCGAEYLPVELFIPDVFFGKPVGIEKDEHGMITDVIKYTPSSTEHYVCDYCNAPFKVSSRIIYNTKLEAKFDFDNDYATSLKKESLFLQED